MAFARKFVGHTAQTPEFDRFSCFSSRVLAKFFCFTWVSLLKKSTKQLKLSKLGKNSTTNSFVKRVMHSQKAVANNIRHKKPNFGFVQPTYTMFFSVFFLHFLNMRSFSLYKSLYKYLTVNKYFRIELNTMLRQTQYLQRKRWSFDFLFFVNFALTFASTNFLIPFFIYHVKSAFEQKKFYYMLIHALRFIFLYKLNIKGIKLTLKGPFERHGRSRVFVSKLGHIACMTYSSFVIYDSIQWPTIYGMVQLRLWVQYKDYMLN